MIRRGILVGLVLLALLPGCSRGPSRQPVSGTIRFEGKPLEFGNIQFFTTSAPPAPACGALIQQGDYRVPREHGLEPGKYRVRISSPVPIKDAPPSGMSVPTRERIPEKFSSLESGDVSIEVTADGPNRFDFIVD